ncbi:MAG TPA: hypothetical protein VEI81_04555, partial [Methanoregula sp.]|nr:hypothetical protein [Methanoregula sp.]
MKTQKRFAGILAIAGIFLAALALIASPVSAAAMTPPVPGGAGNGYGPIHHAFNATQQQARISAELTRLGQQGVDVSQPQADISSGNMTAAMQWLMAYHKANPGSFGNQTRQHAVNTTQQTARLQGFVTKLGQQGVDVTQALADLATGNIPGALQWLTGYYQAHPGTFGNTTHGHAFNSTAVTARIQSSLTKLGQQGVDVSQPQADISSGNMTAAMQWLMAYHKAHPGTGAMNANILHPGNMTAWKNGGSFRQHSIPFGNRTSA